MSKEIERSYKESFSSADRIPQGRREDVVKVGVAAIPFMVGKLKAESSKTAYLWRCL